MAADRSGPAFPRPASTLADNARVLEKAFDGMTKRDYFAAKAMQGICACGPGAHMSNEAIAREAYALADAMLGARE